MFHRAPLRHRDELSQRSAHFVSADLRHYPTPTRSALSLSHRVVVLDIR